MAESVSSQPNESSKSANVLDLEADGLVSVYVNGKFVWQLPKKLLYSRVPAAKPNHADIDEDLVGAHAVWEISGCSVGAFRLFIEWLYSARGHLKELATDKPVNEYLELHQLAVKYKIDDLATAVANIIQSFFSNVDNIASVSESYEALPAKSPGRSSLSARYAALVVTKQLDVNCLKALVKSSELTRDLLIWVVVYQQHGVESDSATYEKTLKWTGENYQLWMDAQE